VGGVVWDGEKHHCLLGGVCVRVCNRDDAGRRLVRGSNMKPGKKLCPTEAANLGRDCAIAYFEALGLTCISEPGNSISYLGDTGTNIKYDFLIYDEKHPEVCLPVEMSSSSGKGGGSADRVPRGTASKMFVVGGLALFVQRSEVDEEVAKKHWLTFRKANGKLKFPNLNSDMKNHVSLHKKRMLTLKEEFGSTVVDLGSLREGLFLHMPWLKKAIDD